MESKTRIARMSIYERFAPSILRAQGYANIHWISLIDHSCPYDFTATKDNVTFLIEVKPSAYKIDAIKIRRLKESNSTNYPVIFLCIDLKRGICGIIPLEDVEKRFGTLIMPQRHVMMRKLGSYTQEIPEDGRMTMAEEIRKKVGVYDKVAFCEAQNIGKDKILVTILHRWT